MCVYCTADEMTHCEHDIFATDRLHDLPKTTPPLLDLYESQMENITDVSLRHADSRWLENITDVNLRHADSSCTITDVCLCHADSSWFRREARAIRTNNAF